MNILVVMIIVIVVLKLVCDMPIVIKQYYKFTWKVQRFLKSIVKYKTLLKKVGIVAYPFIFLILLAGLLTNANINFFIWFFIIPLSALLLFEVVINGYQICINTTSFFRRIVPIWFFSFYAALVILCSFYKQANAYVLYFVLVFIMCIIWFILLSLTRISVMEMVCKILKSGAAILGAIWASVYAFIYIQTPSSIASISIMESLEGWSNAQPYNSLAFFSQLNMLEVLKVLVPIVVLPFLLIIFVSEITCYTKSYWIKHYNNHQDIDYDIATSDNGKIMAVN